MLHLFHTPRNSVISYSVDLQNLATKLRMREKGWVVQASFFRFEDVSAYYICNSHYPNTLFRYSSISE